MSFLGGRDRETLLEQEEAGAAGRRLRAARELASSFATGHPKALVAACDAACVLAFTAVLLLAAGPRCDRAPEERLEWCEPFEPVDQVVVDLNFSLLVHCDEPRSCVAYAENAMESQGFNYNFILGDEDLVYVGKGYQCWSDALRLQMLITRYTWDPKEPVYRVPQEVVIRYSEVIQEGLDCGFLRANFSVSTTCSVYGEYCGAANIRALPWTRPAPLAAARRDRRAWPQPPPQPHAAAAARAFAAFDTRRVYERGYRLQACNASRTDTPAPV